MLSVDSLNVFYGQLHILVDVALEVKDREIVALIGPNGAGKTTLLKALAGCVRPRSGRVMWEGKDLAGRSAAAIVRRRISLAPEGRQLFGPMTVEENLILGAYCRFKASRKADAYRTLERMYGIFPQLLSRRGQLVGTLSGGEQQMVAIGRALMSEPKLLLLDEPSMGLAPVVTKEIYRVIVDLHRQGVTMLLVEQNPRLAFAVAERAYVLQAGRVVAEGRCAELGTMSIVRDVYLGARA